MTDKTATERLREGLTARGVEWWNDAGTWWKVGEKEYHAWQFDDERLCMSACYLTPEQAIAATVGASHDLIDLWREWESVLFANVQDEVVQDKLNECVHALLDKAATVSAGTCKLDGYTDAKFSVCQAPDETDFIDYAEVCECTACGASVIVPHEYERVSYGRDELWPTYNYCPSCGARVEAS